MLGGTHTTGLSWKLSAFNYGTNEYKSVYLVGTNGFSSTLDHLQGVTVVGGFYDSYFIHFHFIHNSGATLTKIKNIEIVKKINGVQEATFTDLSAFYSVSTFYIHNCYNAANYIGLSVYQHGDSATNYAFQSRNTRALGLTGAGKCVNIKAFSAYTVHMFIEINNAKYLGYYDYATDTS